MLIMKDYKNFFFFCLIDVIWCIYKCYILILKSDSDSLCIVGFSWLIFWVMGLFCIIFIWYLFFFVVFMNIRLFFWRKMFLLMFIEIFFLFMRIWLVDVIIKYSSKIYILKFILCCLEYFCFVEFFIWRMMFDI